MFYFLRHLVSVVLLPATVLVLVPIWIARGWNVVPTWPGDVVEWLSAVIGAALGGVGLVLFGSSLRRFAVEGRGTLAPWDPPRRLVVRGPYRYVRNPMISGVAFVLVGLALAMRSWPHMIWAAVFAGINLLFIPLIEEPILERQFGEDYRAYRRRVPRFVPLVRPGRLAHTVGVGSARRARRACEGAARGAGDPASDRAGVRGGGPVQMDTREGRLRRAEFIIVAIAAVLLALAWLYSRATAT